MDDKPRKYSLFPKTLAACVEPLTRPLFKAQGSATTRLITAWESIVGKELARHSAVEKLSFPPGKKNGGTLTIAVEHGFATEFQHMQTVILDRLAEYFGYRAIARMVISPAAMPAAKPQKPVAQPALLPPECCELAKNVDDDELKAALTSLAKTLSGQST